MTRTFWRRDRSVVRSSVIPSAKYCCSGSLLRFAKGRTTIDSRGAGFASLAGGGLVNGTAWAVVAGGLSRGQAHHAVAPIPATRIIAAAASLLVTIRRRRSRAGDAAVPSA